ncbi:MAG TPA: zinc-binding alcohol dehydrogenase family protein [Chthoniobacterales bacterium]
MKALRFSEYGPPSALALEEIPKPEPRRGEVVVQIKATAINPSDVKNVAGAFKSSLPRVPGRDYAGIIVEGDEKKGIEVWGSGAGFGIVRDGAHSEYIVIPNEWISQKPPRLSMEQAATVGVPYLTAWSALVRVGNIQEGETILIVGVSGAVGRAATQIAHWKKAHVIGAARHSDNPAKADAVVNTATDDLAQEVRSLTGGKGADLVLDAVGGLMFEPSLKSLRRGGRQIAISSTNERTVTFNLVDFYHNESRLMGLDTLKFTGPEIAEIMNDLAVGFESGDLEPPPVATWSLERGVEAYEVVAKGAAQTKQVLVPGASKQKEKTNG